MDMPNYHRREFLALALLTAASRYLPAEPVRKGLLLAPSLRRGSNDSTVFSMADLDRGRTEEFNLPLIWPHSWAPHPREGHIGVVPDSGGRKLSIVDLRARASVKTGMTASEDLLCGGHAEFSEDGKVLFVTQFSVKDGAGSVSVRDAESLRELQRYSTSGTFTHEIFKLPDGNLIVANLGHSKKSVKHFTTMIVLEPKSGKILDKKILTPRPESIFDPRKLLKNELHDEASFQLALIQSVRPGKQTAMVIHPTDSALSLWRINNGYRLGRVFSFAPHQVMAITRTADNLKTAVALSNGELRFFDPASGSFDPSYSKVNKLSVVSHVFSSDAKVGKS